MEIPFKKVHVYKKVANTNERRLVKTDPHILIKRKDEAAFLYAGKLLSADGIEIKSVPKWAKDEIDKLSAEALEEVGYEKEEEVVPDKKDVASKGKKKKGKE